MTTPEQDLRASIEAGLQSSSYQNQNVQSPLDMSHSHSINTIQSLNREYIISEDLLAGQRLDGRMSNVRRFFCLFVTFDFLFTGLMWTICVMLDGEYIVKALSEQILHYNIHTSLFDIVLVAFIRFLVLLLFYALISINHWIVISISTTLTCAFLTAKVFLYDWPHSSQPVFEVLLVLVSFVLSWGEAWFLDFRVLPQESHASRYLISNVESERAPLIRSYVQGLPSMYTESVGNFYSPLGSPEGSMYRFEQAPIMYPPVRLTRDQEENYKHLASKTLQVTWDWFKRKDWKLEKQMNGDSVYSCSQPKIGKIYKITGQFKVSPKFLLDELFYKVQDMPKWNPAIKESHKIQVLDENTDITYQVSTDGAGGFVSSRDFVNLRHWALVEDSYVVACTKTDHPSLPVNKKYVRAENIAGGWIMQPVENQPEKCNFCWVLQTNLKIFLPKALIESELIKMMFNYTKDLREHIINSRNSTRND